MEDAISKLRHERTSLRLRLEKLDAAIAEYDRWAASIADLVGSDTPSPKRGSQSETSEPSVEDAEGAVPQSSISEFEESIRLVLGEAEHPYQRGPLLSAIENLGIIISGKSPTNTMGTRLSRMDDIINLKGHGYWLKSRAYPPADYAPVDAKDEEVGRDGLF